MRILPTLHLRSGTTYLAKVFYSPNVLQNAEAHSLLLNLLTMTYSNQLLYPQLVIEDLIAYTTCIQSVSTSALKYCVSLNQLKAFQTPTVSASSGEIVPCKHLDLVSISCPG